MIWKAKFRKTQLFSFGHAVVASLDPENEQTCSDFLVMSTPKALLKKEARSGLSGGGCSMKAYSWARRRSSEEMASLIWATSHDKT